MNFEHPALSDLDGFMTLIRKYLKFEAERVALRSNRNVINKGDVMEVIDNTRFALGRRFFELDETKWTNENTSE